MAHPLRVVQLLGAKNAGGAETFFIRLMVAFAKRPHLIQALPIVRKHSWAARRLAEEGIPFETIRFGGWWDLLGKRRVARLTKAFKADVVMSWMNRATAFVPRGPWVKVARLGGYYKLKYYINKVKYLVGNTQDLCGYLKREGWPEEHVFCLGNFIPEPPEDWREAEEEVRHTWGVPPGRRMFLMAARLHQVKGWDVLFAATAALVKQGQDVGIWVLGDGPLREALAVEADKLGIGDRVVFVGWADNVTPYAAATYAWVVASRQETLGNSVLDAWVHHVPLVSTKTQGPLQLMTDGKDGLFFEIDDVRGLEKALHHLLTDGALAASLAKAGYDSFVKDYAEEVIVTQFIEFYRKLMNKEGA
ncbi:MAG: glycosyl transferase [Alphaproteobacteria bacterium CG_4_10_14_0_8_um_filter_53_9]|nr:MAG: glycosyl transferase [Alphaproteobacteria bacterium CG_4_10_14_0_8_um_filter_53_9]